MRGTWGIRSVEEGAAKTAALLFAVNGQARQQDDRNRIPRRHFSRDCRRAVLSIYGTDGQRVISDHGPAPVDYVALRGISLLILQCMPFNKQVERVLAGFEGIDQMSTG
jgi:hypothetical protein